MYRTLSSFRLHRLFCTSVPVDNYYRLLGIRETFEIDQSLLQTRFKSLQREWHPDKFGNSTPSEQQTATNMSARLNEAYSVLRTPYRRAEHLLKLRSTNPQMNLSDLQNFPLDTSFLTWVMETREEILNHSNNPNQLNQIKSNIDKAMHKCLSNLAKAFCQNQLTAAAEETAKLQYLRRIDQTISDLTRN